MKTDARKMNLNTLVFLPGSIILLLACNLINPAVAEPPWPTIVPVTFTAIPSPTTQPKPIPTPVSQQSAGDEVKSQPTAESQPSSSARAVTSVASPAAGKTATTPVASSAAGKTKEPAPTSTLVVFPTEVPSTPIPTETPVVTQLPSLDEVSLKLIPVAGGFTKPVFLTHAGDGTGRLFVVEQAGRVLILKDGIINPTPFLDIISIVGSDANEQGLLSLAFHPDYAVNGRFFVNYTNRQGDTVIARYNVTGNPGIADPDSEKILMTIGQPYSNHNGGQIAFGPDGYLYIGMGDGGAANDPQNRAQNPGTLLGKILRIDVDNGDPYGVPQTNPFVGNDQARPEIWSYGWRNPWRFSFDLSTNDLYVADVGQNQYEEVHVERAGAPGQNYGWRLMEGLHCFNPRECDPATLNLVLPVAEYDHSLGCSITGGYVYRGTQFSVLNGTYFYGDYCSGIIWGLRNEADGNWAQAQLMQSDKSISSFGQDEAGEVYLVDHKGDIFLLGN